MTKDISKTGDQSTTQTVPTEYTLLLIWGIVKQRASKWVQSYYRKLAQIRYCSPYVFWCRAFLGSAAAPPHPKSEGHKHHRHTVCEQRQLNAAPCSLVTYSPLEIHSAWRSTASSTERNTRFGLIQLIFTLTPNDNHNLCLVMQQLNFFCSGVYMKQFVCVFIRLCSVHCTRPSVSSSNLANVGPRLSSRNLLRHPPWSPIALCRIDYSQS